MTLATFELHAGSAYKKPSDYIYLCHLGLSIKEISVLVMGEPLHTAQGVLHLPWPGRPGGSLAATPAAPARPRLSGGLGGGGAGASRTGGRPGGPSRAASLRPRVTWCFFTRSAPLVSRCVLAGGDDSGLVKGRVPRAGAGTRPSLATPPAGMVSLNPPPHVALKTLVSPRSHRPVRRRPLPSTQEFLIGAHRRVVSSSSSVALSSCVFPPRPTQIKASGPTTVDPLPPTFGIKHWLERAKQGQFQILTTANGALHPGATATADSPAIPFSAPTPAPTPGPAGTAAAAAAAPPADADAQGASEAAAAPPADAAPAADAAAGADGAAAAAPAAAPPQDAPMPDQQQAQQQQPVAEEATAVDAPPPQQPDGAAPADGTQAATEPPAAAAAAPPPAEVAPEPAAEVAGAEAAAAAAAAAAQEAVAAAQEAAAVPAPEGAPVEQAAPPPAQPAGDDVAAAAPAPAPDAAAAAAAPAAAAPPPAAAPAAPVAPAAAPAAPAVAPVAPAAAPAVPAAAAAAPPMVLGPTGQWMPLPAGVAPPPPGMVVRAVQQRNKNKHQRLFEPGEGSLRVSAPLFPFLPPHVHPIAPRRATLFSRKATRHAPPLSLPSRWWRRRSRAQQDETRLPCAARACVAAARPARRLPAAWADPARGHHQAGAHGALRVACGWGGMRVGTQALQGPSPGRLPPLCSRRGCALPPRPALTLAAAAAASPPALQGPVGILCSHCNTVISPSTFEAHAGHKQRRNPYDAIITDAGLSLKEMALRLPPLPEEQLTYTYVPISEVRTFGRPFWRAFGGWPGGSLVSWVRAAAAHAQRAQLVRAPLAVTRGCMRRCRAPSRRRGPARAAAPPLPAPAAAAPSAAAWCRTSSCAGACARARPPCRLAPTTPAACSTESVPPPVPRRMPNFLPGAGRGRGRVNFGGRGGGRGGRGGAGALQKYADAAAATGGPGAGAPPGLGMEEPDPVGPQLSALTSSCVICFDASFDREGFSERTVLICDQCEREFHVSALAISPLFAFLARAAACSPRRSLQRRDAPAHGVSLLWACCRLGTGGLPAQGGSRAPGPHPRGQLVLQRRVRAHLRRARRARESRARPRLAWRPRMHEGGGVALALRASLGRPGGRHQCSSSRAREAWRAPGAVAAGTRALRAWRGVACAATAAAGTRALRAWPGVAWRDAWRRWRRARWW